MFMNRCLTYFDLQSILFLFCSSTILSMSNNCHIPPASMLKYTPDQFLVNAVRNTALHVQEYLPAPIVSVCEKGLITVPVDQVSEFITDFCVLSGNGQIRITNSMPSKLVIVHYQNGEYLLTTLLYGDLVDFSSGIPFAFHASVSIECAFVIEGQGRVMSYKHKD